MDWNHVRAFVATVRSGSLSGAARALGQTQPTIGRQVEALEAQLGVVLFEREGRRLRLTPTGTTLFEHAGAMSKAAELLSLAASRHSDDITGTVKITASDMLSLYDLPRIVAQIARKAPGLRLEIVASDDIQNRQRREADIAIRHARLEQGDLIARLVAESSAGVYAAQSYIDAFGEPSLATGLQGHRFIPFGDPARMTAVMKGYGVELTAENFVHDTASGPVAWAMAREGLGLCLMSRHLGDQSPNMVRVLRDAPPLSFPIWLVTHRELHTSAKIRLVYDALADSILRTFVVADAENESDHAD